MTIFDYFALSGAQGLALAVALATAAGFVVLGAAVGGPGDRAGGRRFPEADLYVGWGLATGAMTVAGVAVKTPFPVMTYLVWSAIAAAGYLLWRRGEPLAGRTLGVKVFVLALPLIVPAAAMKASQWDEFSQWLQNAAFIYRYGGFPQTGLPDSTSAFPAYPYGGPLFGYLVSRVSGFFVENAVAMGNLILLLGLAPVYLHMVRRGLGGDATRLRGWGAAAFGVLGVTALSTTFVQKLVLTAYADTSTAVVLCVLAVLAWMILERLADGGVGDAGARGEALKDSRVLAWQFSLAGALFLNLKQTNPVLFVLLLGVALVVVLRDRDIRFRDALSLLPVMLAAPLVVYLAWRYHVSHYMAGREFQFMPYESWNLGHIGRILGSMFRVVTNKGAYFAMMAGVAGAALWSLVRFGGGFRRMAILAGGVFLAYNLFLFAMYITAFGEFEAVRAGGFWRYNTQLGLLGCTTAAMGLAMVWARRVQPWLDRRGGLARVLPALVIIVTLAAPVVLIKKIRFDVRPQKDHWRMVGQELGRTLPDDSRLGVVDVRGNGFSFVVIHYELTGGVGGGRGLKRPVRFIHYAKSPTREWRRLRERGVDYLWVHEATPMVNKLLGITLARGASHLLHWDGEGWAWVKSWPYDGYDDPYSLPD